MFHCNDPVLTHVTERDMDLLLVEELSCSQAFVSWLAKNLSAHIGFGNFAVEQVHHSVCASGAGAGETDIEVIGRLSSGSTACTVGMLIEDKIDATFTPLQPERYRLRAAELLRSARCGKAVTLLLSPAGYSASGVSGFDARITYEEVVAFFKMRQRETADELQLRYKHRIQLVEQAIHRFRRGYVASPVAEVTNVWQDYWNLCRRIAPHLNMSPPGPKPGDSYSVPFPCIRNNPGAPRCSLYHVMKKGTVDLLFAGLAAEMDRIEPRLAPLLEAGMQLRAAGKSMAITISVSPINPMLRLEEQIVQAQAAIHEAVRLKDWHDRHFMVLARLVSATNV